MLFVRLFDLFDLCLFGFVGFLFLLGAGVCDCGTPWAFLLPFFLCKLQFLRETANITVSVMHSVVSDLGLHCLLMPVCPNT